MLRETLRSLEENGINFVLKAKQKKRLLNSFTKKDLLAFLPTGYGKSHLSAPREESWAGLFKARFSLRCRRKFTRNDCDAG